MGAVVTVDAMQWGAIVLLALVVLGLLLLLVGLLRSYAELVRTLHDLGIKADPGHDHVSEPSSSAPRMGTVGGAVDIVGQTMDGGQRAISLRGGSGPILLAFLSSGCGACMGFWRELRSNAGSFRSVDAPVVVVTKGLGREEPGKLSELSSADVDLVLSDEAWNDYDVPVSPHFALVDTRDGTILGEGSAPDPAGLGGLLSRAIADAKAIDRRTFLRGGQP